MRRGKDRCHFVCCGDTRCSISSVLSCWSFLHCLPCARCVFCLHSGCSFLLGVWRRVRVVKVGPVLYRFNLGKSTFIKFPPCVKELAHGLCRVTASWSEGLKPQAASENIYVGTVLRRGSPKSGALVQNPHQQKIPMARQVLVLRSQLHLLAWN